jgi:hypothetical protein
VADSKELKELWKTDAAAAYAEAERRVQEVLAVPGVTTLRLDDLHALPRFPPEIAACEQLERLNIDNTQVSDLTPLSGLSALQRLFCNNTQVSDLTPLSCLTTLEALHCNSTRVSDLTPVISLTALQQLFCSSTQVSDLRPLMGLTALQTLYCSNTLVSELSPLLRNVNFFADGPMRVWFRGTPLTRRDERWREISEVEDKAERTREAVAYLKAGGRAAVFLSYKREDRARAGAVRDALLAAGIPVWWDQDMPAEVNFRAEVQRRLETCSAVLTLWSDDAIRSDWVQDEAGRGLDRGRFVQATLDGVPPPPPFMSRQLTDLSTWEPEGDDAPITALIDALKRLMATPLTDAEIAHGRKSGAAQAARVAGTLRNGRAGITETPEEGVRPVGIDPALRVVVDEQAALAASCLKNVNRMPQNYAKEYFAPLLEDYHDALCVEDAAFPTVRPAMILLRGALHDDYDRFNLNGAVLAGLDALDAAHDPVEAAIRKTDIGLGQGAGLEVNDAIMEAAETERDIEAAAKEALEIASSPEAALALDDSVKITLRIGMAQIRAGRHEPADETPEHRKTRRNRLRMGAVATAGTLGALASLSQATGMTAPEAFAAVMARLEPLWQILSKIFY